MTIGDAIVIIFGSCCGLPVLGAVAIVAVTSYNERKGRKG